MLLHFAEKLQSTFGYFLALFYAFPWVFLFTITKHELLKYIKRFIYYKT